MFGRKVELAAKAHAMKEYPKESCGVVVDGKYVPKKNSHATPETDFKIARWSKNFTAIIHSHPDGYPIPSEMDMRGQISSALPWGILSCNGLSATKIYWFGDNDVPIAEYVGREFRFPSADCYQLVKDYYQQEYDITLDDMPRSANFWHEGTDILNLANFEKQGWREISAEELLPGDGVIMRVGSPVNNHTGIYEGNGLILHHLHNRLSRREPIEPWNRYIKHFLRHKDRDEDNEKD